MSLTPMADFLTVVTGGPDIHRGRNIREAHRNFNLQRTF